VAQAEISVFALHHHESDLNSVVRYAKSIGMEPFELHCDQSGYLIELEN